MPWLIRAILIVLCNAAGLWLANQYVPGFVLQGNWVAIILVALILSLLNFLLRPFLSLILAPVIVLTLGLATIVINAFMLYLLPIIADHIDFLKGSIMIQNIPALIFATLIVGVMNLIAHAASL